MLPATGMFPAWIEVCLPAPSSESAAALRDSLSEGQVPTWVEDVLRAGLGPLAYWQLTARMPEADIPDPLAQAFWQGLWKEAAQAEWRHHVVDNLRSAGVVVGFLNGSWLSEAVYPQACVRPVGALDLFVAADDLPRAGDVLRTAGFSRWAGEPEEGENPAECSSSPGSPPPACYRQPGPGPRTCRLFSGVLPTPVSGTRGTREADLDPVFQLARPTRSRYGWCLEFPPAVHVLCLLAGPCARELPSSAALPVIDLHWVLHTMGAPVFDEALALAERWGISHLVEEIERTPRSARRGERDWRGALSPSALLATRLASPRTHCAGVR